MNNTNQLYQGPTALNADEFVCAVIALTPAIMSKIKGIVNVDVRLSLDETGRILSVDMVRCNTIKGKPVQPDEPEIVQAAHHAIRTLRFLPAMRAGQPVPMDGLELSFGFTTAALTAGAPASARVH